jgi:hypothetical protein
LFIGKNNTKHYYKRREIAYSKGATKMDIRLTMTTQDYLMDELHHQELIEKSKQPRRPSKADEEMILYFTKTVLAILGKRLTSWGNRLQKWGGIVIDAPISNTPVSP